MAKLKGLKKIDKIINEFTKQFGVTADLDTEFEAFCDQMKIGYTLVYGEMDKDFFIEDAQMRYPEIKADIFLWSLLHEIGHCLTEDFWTEEEREYFWAQKEACAYMRDDKDRNDWYHALPDEFFATKWAGDYMRNHPKRVAKFWNKLQPAIMNFYIKNGLIEE